MSEQDTINKTMLRQFFNNSAVKKVEFLVERGHKVELVDDQIATLTGPQGMCEVDVFGSVRWIN